MFHDHFAGRLLYTASLLRVLRLPRVLHRLDEVVSPALVRLAKLFIFTVGALQLQRQR